MALERENREFRAVIETLWADLQMRYRLASGKFDNDPVPPLMMLSGDVFMPVREEAA